MRNLEQPDPLRAILTYGLKWVQDDQQLSEIPVIQDYWVQTATNLLNDLTENPNDPDVHYQVSRFIFSVESMRQIKRLNWWSRMFGRYSRKITTRRLQYPESDQQNAEMTEGYIWSRLHGMAKVDANVTRAFASGSVGDMTGIRVKLHSVNVHIGESRYSKHIIAYVDHFFNRITDIRPYVSMYNY